MLLPGQASLGGRDPSRDAPAARVRVVGGGDDDATSWLRQPPDDLLPVLR